MTPEKLSELIEQIQASSTEKAAEFLRDIFDAVWPSLVPYWPYAVGAFFVLLVIATIKLFFGQWGAMGSLIYHTIYFGVLAVIIAIWGIEILLNPYFDIVYALLYPASYWITGVILRGRLGVH